MSISSFSSIPSRPALAGAADPGRLFVRLTKRLSACCRSAPATAMCCASILRLRPDPGSTAVAVALPAAFAYYEMLGQNWERAALSRRGPSAGDIALGRGFSTTLTPFIWRKYFDYAAIADIHAMKRQIHAVRGHAEITVAGP